MIVGDGLHLSGHISPSQFGMIQTRRPLFGECLSWLGVFPQFLWTIIHWFWGEGRWLEIPLYLVEDKEVGEGREKVGEWLAELTACL